MIDPMVELQRTVRLCINDGDAAGPTHAPPARRNGFSAWPPIRGLGRFYQVHVACEGRPDPATGYLVNIRELDRAVHEAVLPQLTEAVAARDGAMGGLMRRLFDAVAADVPHRLTALRLDLTPFVWIEARPRLEADVDHVTLAQRYEFSAAHRLHVPELGDAENRRIFGKCNNPAGHGHNYELEVAVRCPIDPAGRIVAVEDLDALVDVAVIEPLDHKHLNIDVPAFAERNPSVEHIAQVVWQMLAARIAELGVTLEHVRVWETGKTACTYRGDRFDPVESSCAARRA